MAMAEEVVISDAKDALRVARQCTRPHDGNGHEIHRRLPCLYPVIAYSPNTTVIIEGTDKRWVSVP